MEINDEILNQWTATHSNETHFQRWWWEIDPYLFWTTVILLCLGLIMVFSASMTTSLISYSDPYYFFKKQILGVGVSLFFFIIASFIKLDFVRKMSSKLLLLSVILLTMVFFPHIGGLAGGSYRWINFGILNFQPSELAKLSLILYMADTLVSHRHRAQDFWYGVVPFLLVVGVMGVLVIMEPDLGTTIFLAAITFIMLFLGGRKIVHLLYPIFVGIPILLFLIFASGNQYWKARLEAFVNPWKEPLGKGFQIIQSLIAIGSGGLFGRGLGESRQKFFYLPDRHTDFIFAIIGEELGFIGTIGVVILFCILFWRGWLIAVRSGDDFQAMLAMGIILSILMQVIVNMSAVLKILPVSGVPLPLVSYGNSSILITMIEIGLLFNIARQSKVNHFE